jgi:hypothetical protein
MSRIVFFCLFVSSFAASANEITTCYAQIVGAMSCLTDNTYSCDPANTMAVDHILRQKTVKQEGISETYPKNNVTEIMRERFHSVGSLIISSTSTDKKEALSNLENLINDENRKNFDGSGRLTFEVLGCKSVDLVTPADVKRKSPALL